VGLLFQDLILAISVRFAPPTQWPHPRTRGQAPWWPHQVAGSDRHRISRDAWSIVPRNNHHEKPPSSAFADRLPNPTFPSGSGEPPAEGAEGAVAFSTWPWGWVGSMLCALPC